MIFFFRYVVANCDSVLEIVRSQKWLQATREDASAYSLKTGLELDCSDYYSNFLPHAVAQGKVKEADMYGSHNYFLLYS
ncbi:hypothetical protein REPUB_Repub09cG0064900 [Reevesia pubescens]